MTKLKLYSQVLTADYRRLKRIEKNIKKEIEEMKRLISTFEHDSEYDLCDVEDYLKKLEVLLND